MQKDYGKELGGTMRNNKKGGIEYLTAFMMICLIGLLLTYSFSVKELRQYEIDAKDSLDSACLSAAVIDLKDYRQARFINIRQRANSWYIFKECLKNNMGLNSKFEPVSKTSIYDKVTVHEFIVYNIIEGNLTSYRVDENGKTETASKQYTKTDTTPDGTLIVSSTIYADIGMNVTSFLGIKEYVHVRTSVDVVNN